MEAQTYEEALARAAAGEEIDPRHLAWLKRVDEKHARHDDETEQAARAIEQARAEYIAEGEQRIEAAHEQVATLREELEQARATHADTLEKLHTAQAEHDKAREAVHAKFRQLWSVATKVWAPGGPPRDESGNPVSSLCVHVNEVLVNGVLVSKLKDRPATWETE